MLTKITENTVSKASNKKRNSNPITIMNTEAKFLNKIYNQNSA